MVTANEILFGHKLKPEVLKCSVQEFVDKVQKISQDLLVVPDWLMLVMELETAGTFSPSITNSLGYTGLIQFGRDRAKEAGTSRNALRKMNAVDQLEYVYLALLPFAGRMNTIQDVYLAVFFPAAIGKPLGWTLHARNLPAEKVGKWNPLFDIDKDGVIQVWEIKKKLLNRIPTKYRWIA
ncbi:hypothetical protein [Christiangramia forsetii]|uniref:EF-hand domain-containing protein n=2 Tax=Christiangramia forsetii TaxID=411153 RepID=A0M428_CHRFK|nr:hypothetical protein [Christiangramia forsetii]GGG24386.1 hypothetical protein GCM10011532_04550 [Christiangramia forsetii]CAL67373.1 conserved hypothetical protein [Christiangramia forsetii KT0803]